MALSENNESRKRQLRYLFGSGIFDRNDFQNRFLKAFPELRAVINEVKNNERLIKLSEFTLKNPGVAMYYYRFTDVSRLKWTEELRDEYDQEKAQLFEEYDSLPYDRKPAFNLSLRLKDLNSKYYEIRLHESRRLTEKFDYSLR